MTPFVVTTKRDDGPKLGWIVGVPSISRVAVATLEKARAACFSSLDRFVARDGSGRTDEWRAVDSAVRQLPESGGTVGPLPDGTTIEVAADTGQMRAACPLIFSSDWVRMSDEERCAAYNAREARR